MTDTLTRVVALGAALILSGWARAHDGIGPNGGRLADLPNHHIELVVNDDTVNVFVSDKDTRPISALGLAGTAIVMTPGGSMRIPLVASDASRLSGNANGRLSNAGKRIVQVRLVDGQTIIATFD